MSKKAEVVKRAKSVKAIQSRPINSKGRRPAQRRKGIKAQVIEQDYFSRLPNAKVFTVDQVIELVLHEANGGADREFTDGLRDFVEWCVGAYPGLTCGGIKEKVDTIYANNYSNRQAVFQAV